MTLINTNEERQKALAQVIANSFFAMQAGEWPGGPNNNYGIPTPNAGDMQLAYDILDAGYRLPDTKEQS